jgi:ATP-dependent DNA helicase RecG
MKIEISAKDRTDLLDKLAAVDISVPPRTQGRRKDHCERWAICRWLSTYPNFSFPIQLTHRDKPDFFLETSDLEIGIEHTEAIPEDYAHASVISERLDNDILTDWSIKIVTDARIDHLDPVAIGKARESYARKYSNRFSLDVIQEWSDIAFLDRSRLTIEGKITRAALLLLGKPESAFLLSPHPAQMTWKLEGAERAYEHFGLPFLLNSTALYQKIRNVQIRILPDNQLFPVEVSKYEQKIVLEALHNCIAHQDYTKNGRIIVTEYLDMLVFENEGSFYEGKPADYISGEKTPRRYRNAFLAHAMTELNMIDTMGYGIHQIHTRQAKRYFPLPDFDLQNGNSVKMKLHGKVVDPAYSKALMERTDLTLPDIIALDHIQKKKIPAG